MTTTKPEHGEYWTCKGTRVRIVGLHSGGDYVCELKAGDLTILPLGRAWQHLPDCTGWDWQPETFPQYWTAINDEVYAYCERVAADKYRMIKRDGSVMPHSFWNPDSGRDRTQITKEEAEALVERPFTQEELTASYQSLPVADLPPAYPTNQQLFEMIANLRDQMDAMNKRIEATNESPQESPEDTTLNSLEGTKIGTVKITPVESPDDWVEIEKTKFPLHIPRSKYDKIIGHTEPLEVAGGRSFVHDGCSAISHVTWKGYKFVCRRKDLPPLPTKIIDVSPGDNYRWLDADEIVEPTDDVFRPDLFDQWVPPQTRVGSLCGSDDYPVRRSIARTIKAPLPSTKRVPVRLYWFDGNIVGRYDHSQPTDPWFQEIYSDGNGGWYVEVQP